MEYVLYVLLLVAVNSSNQNISIFKPMTYTTIVECEFNKGKVMSIMSKLTSKPRYSVVSFNGVCTKIVLSHESDV